MAVFEHAIENAKGHYSFLDLFWPGVLLVEHKTAGASLDKAESQAFKYLADLAREGRHEELPRYVILCDFVRFSLFDLEPEDQKDLPLFDDGRRYRRIEFPLPELHRYVRQFAFMRGEKAFRLDPEDPANLKATQLLAELHDALEFTGFSGHALERMLVRLLFCLFAEDTGIFDAPGCFTSVVERSREDGSDLGQRLAQLFDVLDTPFEKRQKNLDEDFASFPYVNGGLFEESLRIATFNSDHRNALLACCRFHWAKISPAVFGSLFQGVLDKKDRRQLGAHYTSERDIVKLLRALFLDELRAELDAALGDKSSRRNDRLKDFQKKLRSLKLFDPACGCGNFLILAYRELRRLENEALIAVNTNSKGEIQAELVDIRALAQVDVDQFYGIEIGEWPVRIAEVGLWLTDHQCNVELAEAMGRSFRRLPLKASPTLKVANSLQTDWAQFLPPSDNVYVLGNPPFVGAKFQSADQRKDMSGVAAGVDNYGLLDYVAAWYLKAAQYLKGTAARCAFVSTNSITQGEQAGTLWNYLFHTHSVKIHFGYRTFTWTSEAKGKAHVHVVIIGFGAYDWPRKKIFETDPETGAITTLDVSNISPYLIQGPDRAITNRSEPLSDVPTMVSGNKPIDDGNYLFTPEEKNTFLREESDASPFFFKWLGGEEFINGIERWCLYLADCPPEKLRHLPQCLKRVEAVKTFRAASKSLPTQKLAATPLKFHTEFKPHGPYLALPQVSSERRRYIPIAFLDGTVLCGDKLRLLPDATLWHFGVLISGIHMAWMRTVTGRLKSDYQYSVKLVYNNFPWPEAVTESNQVAVEQAAKKVLQLRDSFPGSTLADLYDPLAMPAALVDAHADVDRAVDRCYRKAVFSHDRERVEHLFELHDKLTAPLLPAKKATSRGRKNGAA